jgi:hypothetical protein
MTDMRDLEIVDLPPHGKTRAEWLGHLRDVGAGHGFFDRIGAAHAALFVEEGNTLLVTFDRAERVYAQSFDGMPSGFEMVRRREWSYLSILSMGPMQFRDAELHAFFDRLIDDGFFDSYAQVMFLGLGPVCGHAACAYSAAAPHARVIASRPAARLDSGTGKAARFSDAPALLSVSEAAALLFDPTEPHASANAARFDAPQITRVSLPHTAPDLEKMIRKNDLTVPMFRAMGNLRLDAARVREILRPVRHAHPDHMMRMAETALHKSQPRRAAIIARHAFEATGEHRFRALLSLIGAAPTDAVSG